VIVDAILTCLASSVMISDLALDALQGGKSVSMWEKDLNLSSFVARVAGKTIRNAKTHARAGNALNVARSVSAFRGRAEVMVPVSKRSVLVWSKYTFSDVIFSGVCILQVSHQLRSRTSLQQPHRRDKVRCEGVRWVALMPLVCVCSSVNDR
jgi:hypothetical protein